MSVVVIVGNPKPASRTAHAASLLATALTGAAPDHVVDVVDLGPGLLGWEDPKVMAAVKTAAGDHGIVLLEIEALTTRRLAEPLVFHGGQVRALQQRPKSGG